MKILYHAKLYINRLTSLGIFCFAYDPPTMGWSSWMPDIDGMVLLKK